MAAVVGAGLPLGGGSRLLAAAPLAPQAWPVCFATAKVAQGHPEMEGRNGLTSVPRLPSCCSSSFEAEMLEEGREELGSQVARPARILPPGPDGRRRGDGGKDRWPGGDSQAATHRGGRGRAALLGEAQKRLEMTATGALRLGAGVESWGRGLIEAAARVLGEEPLAHSLGGVSQEGVKEVQAGEKAEVVPQKLQRSNPASGLSLGLPAALRRTVWPVPRWRAGAAAVGCSGRSAATRGAVKSDNDDPFLLCGLGDEEEPAAAAAATTALQSLDEFTAGGIAASVAIACPPPTSAGMPCQGGA